MQRLEGVKLLEVLLDSLALTAGDEGADADANAIGQKSNEKYGTVIAKGFGWAQHGQAASETAWNSVYMLSIRLTVDTRGPWKSEGWDGTASSWQTWAYIIRRIEVVDFCRRLALQSVSWILLD